MSQPNLDKTLPPEVDLLATPEQPENAVAPYVKQTPAADKYHGQLRLTVAQVEACYAPKLADGSVTKEQLQKITWLLSVAKEAGYNLDQISEKIGYDSDTTLYRVFRGSYSAKLVNVIEKIDVFRKLWEERLGVSKMTFAETSLSREIFDYCDLTRTYQTINSIYGDSQTGKSFALQEYRRLNNHGQTVYIPMPSGGHLTKFLIAACKAVGVSPKGSSTSLAARFIGALTENMLLLIDEVHQTCLGDSAMKLVTLEFIRLDVYEAVHCGIVLCGTNVARDEFERGKHHAWLEQTRRRGMPTLQLPSMLPREDMDALAASYGLPPAPDDIHDLRTKLIKRHGLRAYVNFMRAGAKLAFNKGNSVEWSHFVSAHDALAKLSTGAGK